MNAIPTREGRFQALPVVRMSAKLLDYADGPCKIVGCRRLYRPMTAKTRQYDVDIRDRESYVVIVGTDELWMPPSGS